LDAECWDGSSITWNNLGTVPSYTVDLGGLTTSPDGTLRSGAHAGSFRFTGIVKTVSGLNIGPQAAPQLTLEIWVKRVTTRNVREWIIGHDNGGYDRAIALNDNRFGGVAAPNGDIPRAELGFLELGQWYHVVATYGAHAKIYLNGIGQDEGEAKNGEGTPDMSIGGLTNFAEHDVDALISQVRVYNRELSNTEVINRYESTRSRYGR
jgi:hypothetical protein